MIFFSLDWHQNSLQEISELHYHRSMMKITAHHQKRLNYIKDLGTFINELDHKTAFSRVSIGVARGGAQGARPPPPIKIPPMIRIMTT